MKQLLFNILLISLVGCTSTQLVNESDNFHKTGFITKNCFQFTIENSSKSKSQGLVTNREKNNYNPKIDLKKQFIQSLYEYYKKEDQSSKININSFDGFFENYQKKITKVASYYSQKNNKIFVYRVKDSSLKNKLKKIK